MKVTALIPWFGAARMIAHEVGKELAGCRWVGIPFAGGMPELAHITAPSVVVNDKHRHVMNLASVVASGLNIAKSLAKMPFHPDVLKFAQAYCIEMELGGWDFSKPNAELEERWALNYFITQWMGRSGKGGIDDEFNGGLSIRWNGNGGDSNTRYRSAVKSLVSWHRIMRRCNFSVLDCFDFLARVEDRTEHGLYCDPPWPDDGDRYKHGFTVEQHTKLADQLSRFEYCRVVVRFGDHPLIRKLYSGDDWHWRAIKGRTQANNEKAEVLITNRATEDVNGLFD